MSARRLLLLDLALLASLVVASRAALVIHEVGGHALPAAACGETNVRLSLSLFGGGRVDWDGAVSSPVVALGGIALNLLTGGLAWAFARGRIVPLVFGVGSVGQAFFYLGNGTFWQAGDPAGLWPQWLWPLFVPPFAAVAYFAARAWLRFLGRHAAVDTWRRRIGWSGATMGAAAAAYLGLWWLSWNPRAEATLADLRVQEEMREEQARRSEPAVPVTRADVASRMPLPWAMIALLAGGAAASLAALVRAAPPVEPAELSARACVLLAGVAGLLLGAIALLL